MAGAEEGEWTFQLEELRTELRPEGVSVAWRVTQPCVQEYTITVCTLLEDDTCWTGNFSRPKLETEEDFEINIKLETLSDFLFEFKECQEYEISIQPTVGGRLLETRVQIPFIYKSKPHVVRTPQHFSYSYA